MVNQKGESHVVDDIYRTDHFVDSGAGYRFYDGFVHPHSPRSRGCPAGGQSQSGGYDQPKAETCIAKSRLKTKWQTEARAVNGPTDAITDYAMRYRIDAVLKNPNRHADPS
jgi:hypothetical protein